MEQDESLKSELRNLARLEQEQIQILQAMRSDDQIYKNMTQVTKNQSDVSFDTPSMYAVSSEYMSKQQQSVNYQPQLISPYAQQMNQRFGQSIDSLKGGNGNYGFASVVSPASSYSPMSRTLMNMDYSARTSQAVVAGATALGSTITSFGLGSALPGLAGLGVGIGGGAVLGVYADKANEEIQKNSALKKYIYKNSGKFIDSFESNNDRGVTGFSRKESEDAANFVRTMNNEFYMSDDDTMMLLQKFTEGGLLKETKDLDSFKDKMTTLTKTVKESALMLNETYDSIADLMAEMKKAGIDQKDFKSIASLGNVLGGLMGEDGGDVVRNFIDFVKNLNSGTPLDNTKSLSRLSNTSIYLSQYYDQLKQQYSEDPTKLTTQQKNNKNMVENLGGVEQASEYMMATIDKMADNEAVMNSGLMYFDWDQNQQDFVFNKKAFNEYLQTDHSLESISENASKKLNTLIQSGQGDAVVKWQDSYSTYVKNSMNDGELTDAMRRAVKDFTNDPQMKANGFDQRTIMRKYFGVEDTGAQNLLSGLFDFKGDNPNLERDVKLQSAWQQSTASLLAKSPSLTEIMKSKWEGFTDNVTQGAVNLDNWLGEKFQKLSEKISGADKINPRYDKTLKTTSNLDSISYNDVVESINQNNKIIATSSSALQNLSKKGYSINNDLADYVQNKFNNIDTTVAYDRDIISNWDSISKDLQDVKQNIMDTAQKNDLSEIIVAALNKYNQNRPDKDKINIGETAKKLKDEVFSYGGNYQAALAVSVAGAKKEDVDNAFKSAGYNMDQLREVGGQSAVKDINLDSLDIGEDIKNIVSEILRQNLTGNIQASGYGEAVTGAFSAGGNSSAESINNILTGALAGKGQTYVDLGRKWGIDPALVAAITMQETGGNSSALVNQNNPAGIMDWTNNWRTVKSFDSFDEGLDFVFKNIKENYIDQGLTSVEAIQKKYAPVGAANDPSGLNAGWAPGVSTFYSKATQGVDASENWTNEGAGSNNIYSSVLTTKEKVKKDVTGNTINEEEDKSSIFDSVKNSYTYSLNTSAYERMRALDKRNDDSITNRTSDDRLNDVAISLKEMTSKNTKYGHYYSEGLDELRQSATVARYLESLNKVVVEGKYSSLDDALGDKDVSKQRERIVKMFGNDEQTLVSWQKELARLESTEYVAAEGKTKFLDNDENNKFAALEQFGRTRGIRKEDFSSDLGQYTELLNEQAQYEYDKTKQMMKDVSNGADTEASRQFYSMSTGEKRSMINLAKELGYVVEDDDEWSVENMIDRYGESSFQSDEDNAKLAHLKKDGAKGWVYDRNYDSKLDTSKSAKQADWSDYDEWVKQGEQEDKLSQYTSDYNALKNVSTIDSSETISSMKKKINDQIDGLLVEVNERTKELKTESKAILSGSTGNNAIDALNQDQRKMLSEAVQSRDGEKIQSAQQSLGLSDDAVASYKELVDSLNGIDITSLNEFIKALDEIQEKASDISKLTTTLAGDLGETFTNELKENVIKVMSDSFDEDSDIYKSFADKRGNFNYDELIAALNTGKDSNGTDLSAESIDQLSAAMSKAVSETMGDRLSTKDGINDLRDSSTYKAIDGANKEQLDTLLGSVGNLADKIAEATEKGYYTQTDKDGKTEKIEIDTQGIEDLKNQQKELIDQTTELYQKSLKSLTDNQKDEVDALDKASEAAKKAQQTAKDFESAMDKYDAAMSTAITKLNGRVSKLDSEVSALSLVKNFFSGGNTVSRN